MIAGLRLTFLRGFVERTIRLVAKQPLSYAGREFVAGDVFLAKPIDAAVLKYQRRVDFADTNAELTPEPAPQRRRYRRRDLQAEA